MLEEQHVVVARLEQGPLEGVGFSERDPSQVAAAEHLALALQVHSREELCDALQVVGRGHRLADPMVEREAEHEASPHFDRRP